MKVSFEWLKEYFDENLDLNDLCEKLTISGTKVETVESNKIQVTNVVTGLIEEIKPHPDAEKLVVCNVNVGDKNVQIVTGAKNMKQGDIVPVALHGAVLVGGLKIKKGKLRGVESQGMMCSEEELGIADKADGLMIMDKDTPIGVDIVDVLNTDDEIIEFEITSNRPDCLGVLGIAREIKTIYDIGMKVRDTKFEVDRTQNINDILSVEVKNKNCRRYSARIIKNIKICESPKFIQNRLKNSGIKPINNIVDLTNYVMLELGQPMHAFDYDKISAKKLIVGSSKENEKFVMLDEAERELNESMICIRDDEKVLALAGVMGGKDSKVTDDTKTIVLESASFNFDIIRKTSRFLNLRTESSLRFEKNIDDNLVIDALDRFCSLVTEFSYGNVIDGTVDIVNESYKPISLNISSQYINNFLKTSISENEIIKIFTNLGMEVIQNNENFNVKIPTFRRDIFIKQDLVEEIARIYGYDKIPSLELTSVSADIGKNKRQRFIDKILNAMISLGFNQSISYSFYSPKLFDKLNIDKDSFIRNAISIKNPLGEDYSIMRTIMVPSMLDALCRNYSYSNSEVCIFEIGKTYNKDQNDNIKENNVLTIGMYGKDFDYFSIKGVVESLFEMLGISFTLERENEKFYHPGKAARIMLGKNNLGRFGSIHPYVLKNYDVDIEFFVGGIDLDKLFELYKWEKKYKQIPKYPSVGFDLSIVIDENVLVQEIEKVIKSKSGNILEKFEIFDVYKGPQIPEGKKSVSYSITFRDKCKTLNDNEVNIVVQKILEDLKNKFGAELRQ